MTCRERLAKEHPEKIDSYCFGGCRGCPDDYNYLPSPEYCKTRPSESMCEKCWDREIPEIDISWEHIKEIINEAMEKRDRSVSLYFNPSTGMSVSVYPWPDADELYKIYRKGRISENDFREKMGLSRVEIESNWNMLNKNLQIPKE